MLERLLNRMAGSADPEDPACRRVCGALSGGVGIGVNLLLAGGKLGAGLATASVAILADAVNNLSDAATSVVTLVGFRLAGQKADARHPFGHGRIEYVSGLIVAMAILLMGVEVLQSALRSLFHREEIVFSWVAAAILAVSILAKFGLFLFNRALGRQIRSEAMAATAADSLSDMLSTGVVLLSTLVSHWFHIQVDGLAGLLVAVLILKAGWEAAKDTLNPLLGRPMDPQLAEDIDRLVLSHEHILGIHDLVYHDYGPGRAMMSFHAEVPAEGNFIELHDQIDHIERELKERHHIDTVIHMDPVVRDERTEHLREQVKQAVAEVSPLLSIHDFRVVPGPSHTNLIFDLVVPYGAALTVEEINRGVEEKIRALDPSYWPVFVLEHSYVAGWTPEDHS